MTPEQLARLEQLGNHLLTGQLAHRHFDFNTVNGDQGPNGFHQALRDGVCGTNGCAIGELPLLWPEQFAWRNGGLNLAATGEPYYIDDVGCHWFGLEEFETQTLFFPCRGQSILDIPILTARSGCVGLPALSTKEEVGQNILKLVEWKKKTYQVYDKDPISSASEAGKSHPEGEAGAQGV